MGLDWLTFSDDNDTRVAQSVTVVRQMPMNILGNGLGFGIGALTIYPFFSLVELLPLMLLPTVFVLPMIFSWLRLKGRPRPEKVSQRRIRTIIIYSSALGITLAGLIVFYLGRLPTAYAAFFVTSTAFLAVGAVTALSVIPAAAIGYALPIMLANIYVSFTIDDQLSISLGLMNMLMLLGLSWFLRNNWQGFISEIRAHREAMRSTRELLLESQRLAHTGYILVDAKSGRIYWSESLFQIRGIPPRDWFSDEENLSFIDPRDREKYRLAKADGIKRRQPFSCEHRFRHPDGQEHWEALSGLPKYDEKGELDTVLIVVQDISELRKGQIDLTLLHERRELALNSIDDMFLLWDSDHRLIYFNSKAKAITGRFGQKLESGLTFADFMGFIWKSSPALTDSIGRDEFITSQLYRLVSDMPPLIVELSDGLWLKLRERVTASGEIAVVGSDISESKLREEELSGINLMLRHEILALERRLEEVRGIPLSGRSEPAAGMKPAS